MKKEKKKENLKRWLEKLAKKEGVKLKEIRFISDDFRARAERDGTIRIPEDLFSPFFKSEEREAVGSHEMAHLKYGHPKKVEDKYLKGCSLLILLIFTSLFCFVTFKTIAIIYIGFGISFSMGAWRICAAWRYQLNSEFEADRYAAKETSPAAMIAYLRKRKKVWEKWRRKNLKWRIIVLRREHDLTHPNVSERIKRLEKL
jgi:Zn-dependent protease with chaperone function